MCERNEKEIADKIMGEFSKFVEKCSKEYNMGTGMLVVATNNKNTDAMMGTIFGNASTFDENTEKCLREVAKETLDGSVKAAKERAKEKNDIAHKIADKVVEIAEQLAELETKKAKVWDIAHEMKLIKNGKIDTDKLAKFVKRNNGNEKDVENFTQILEEMIAEHKED